MKDEKNTEQNIPFWTQMAELPGVKGPVLGGGVMFLVTPFLTWTNYVLKGESLKVFPLRQWMAGATSYAVAALPCYAVTFTTMSVLGKMLGNDAKKYELSSAFFSGALSGVVSAPFENLAQNMQLTQSRSAIVTAKQMIAHNGYRSFFQGTGSIVLREGVWACLYFSAIQELKNNFLKKGYSEKQASGFSALLLAGSFGVLSTPLNQLRFKKQEGLTVQKEPKSYRQYAREIWNQEPAAPFNRKLNFFFKASFPRAITTTFAAALITEGDELYDNLVNSFKK